MTPGHPNFSECSCSFSSFLLVANPTGCPTSQETLLQYCSIPALLGAENVTKAEKHFPGPRPECRLPLPQQSPGSSDYLVKDSVLALALPAAIQLCLQRVPRCCPHLRCPRVTVPLQLAHRPFSSHLRRQLSQGQVPEAGQPAPQAEVRGNGSGGRLWSPQTTSLARGRRSREMAPEGMPPPRSLPPRLC